ncbi:MAG: FAD:protein FMN transferase [Chromatiales bacterium]|nr:FAD:protein FMN transferase [Chromatiales bacterium]
MSRGRVSLLLLAVTLAALLIACAPTEKEAYKRQFFSLGTLIEISLWDVDDERAAKAVRRVEEIVNDAHQRWHAWEPSEITALNTAIAEGQSLTLSPATIAALRRARELAAASGQLFNPAIGRLIALWGFHSDEPPHGPPPTQAAIDALLAQAPDMDALWIEGLHAGSNNPAVQLDLGAFAKGYTVDLAIAALRELGIENAIVNAGGDLRAIGSHGKRPWSIGIRQPADHSEGGILASIETHGDEAVFTSGDYERFFYFEGRRYHHILDPRDGFPARQVISVTAIGADGATADAAVTGLFVAGPDHWQEVAQRMGITQVMMIDTDMRIYMTAEMARRVHFEIAPPAGVFIAGESPRETR